MRTYRVFVKKGKAGDFEDLIMLREGINVCALLFGPIWMLVHKLWLILTLWIAVFSLSFLLLDFLVSLTNISYFESVPIALIIILYMLPGVISEDLRQKKLMSSGYELLGYSMGSEESDARMRFFDAIGNDNMETEGVKTVL